MVIHSINYGGAGKMFAFLANKLYELGNEVFVYTYEGVNPYYPLSSGIKLATSPTTKMNKLRRRLRAFSDVRKFVEISKPDIVLSFMTNANLYSIVATRPSRIPVIIAERGDPFSERGLLTSMKRWFYRFAEGAVFQTDNAKSFYGSRLQSKGIVIPNPVTITRKSLPHYQGRNDEIICVGRFHIKQKRQDLMVKAFKTVIEKHPNFRLVFLGDGEDQGEIQEMVYRERLTDKVIFEGRVENVIDRIRKARIFVLSSDYEGIPNSLIEAMAIGLPVVSTDCSPGGARLLIKNGENGLLVPKGDEASLSRAILFMIENPEIAEQYGKNAQNIIEVYSPAKIIGLWEMYIDQTIHKHYGKRKFYG